MRRLPEVPVPPVEPVENTLFKEAGKRKEQFIKQTRKYELITPLFGGGVDPATADPVTIIRGTSIRGQLRFWWRATRGGQFEGDLQKMKDRENEIWGSASTEKKPLPSKVQIVIETTDKGRIFRPRDGKAISDLTSLYGYVAFPLRDKPGYSVIEGVKFTLTISFYHQEKETIQKEVDAALWAWETFGGIGARTRRGFGALRCIEVDNKSVPILDSKNLRHEIDKGIASHVVKGIWHKNVPHLSIDSSHYCLTEESNSVIASWEYLIKKLKAFRQFRHNGRGRSLWPEPDAIRRLTKQQLAKHSTAISNITKFPRGHFGLPIIFEFKDQDKLRPNNPNSDPAKATLQGSTYDRLASPLIFRPVACSGNQAVGLAVILDTPRNPEGGVKLTNVRGEWDVQSELVESEAQKINPLKDRSSDVLVAFLKFLQEKS